MRWGWSNRKFDLVSAVITITKVSPKTRRQDRLEVCAHFVVTDSGSSRHRLAGPSIRQQPHDIYWFGGPFGIHLSYHDADGQNPWGIIHQRLNPKQGKFLMFPGGASLGYEAFSQPAPAFGDISGVFPVPPQVMVKVAKDALLNSMEAVSKKHRYDHSIELQIPREANWILGPMPLLLQPNAERDLAEWCETQMELSEVDGAFPFQAYVFDVLRPWLAIVVGWSR